MIYLNAENYSALGDDTFWLWMRREFKGSRFGVPGILFSYSTYDQRCWVTGRTQYYCVCANI